MIRRAQVPYVTSIKVIRIQVFFSGFSWKINHFWTQKKHLNTYLTFGVKSKIRKNEKVYVLHERGRTSVLLRTVSDSTLYQLSYVHIAELLILKQKQYLFKVLGNYKTLCKKGRRRRGLPFLTYSVRQIGAVFVIFPVIKQISNSNFKF